MKRILWLWGLALAFGPATSEWVLAQDAPLFASEETLHLTLETDWSALLKDRSDDAEERPATLAYAGEDGAVVSQAIKLRLRGNFRRQERNCTFPPLRLNIAGKAARGTIFEGQDKLKLVTHCQDRRPAYEQYVLLEHLIYRMYGQLTDRSFRVRLVQITYVDASGAQKPQSRYGFLIEDDDAMAARNGGSIVEREGLHQEFTDSSEITTLSVFQYMIGNTDWSVPARHNITLIQLPGRERPVAVPYDFDFSGLISTPYALPGAGLPIKTVYDRLYRGYCRTEDELEPHLDLFREKRAALYALVDALEPLKRKYRKQAIRYLDGFYRTLDSEKDIERAFMRSCRQME